jgi:hypothetical protein
MEVKVRHKNMASHQGSLQWIHEYSLEQKTSGRNRGHFSSDLMIITHRSAAPFTGGSKSAGVRY